MEDSAKFCIDCGTQNASAQQKAHISASAIPKLGRKKTNIIIACAVTLALVVCIIIGNSNSPRKQIVGDWGDVGGSNILISFYRDGTFTWHSVGISGYYKIQDNNSLLIQESSISLTRSRYNELYLWDEDWTVARDTLWLDGDFYCERRK